MKYLYSLSLTLLGCSLLAISSVGAMGNDLKTKRPRRSFQQQQPLQQQTNIKAATDAISELFSDINALTNDLKFKSSLADSQGALIGRITTFLDTLKTLYANEEINSLLENKNSTIIDLITKLQEKTRSFIVDLNAFVIPTEIAQRIQTLEQQMITTNQKLSSNNMPLTLSSTANNSNNFSLPSLSEQSDSESTKMQKNRHFVPTQKAHTKTPRLKPAGQTTRQSCLASSSLSMDNNNGPKLTINPDKPCKYTDQDTKAPTQTSFSFVDNNSEEMDLLTLQAIQELLQDVQPHSSSSSSSSTTTNTTSNTDTDPEFLLAIAESLKDLQVNNSSTSTK
jgi:hypothetical protein